MVDRKAPRQHLAKALALTGHHCKYHRSFCHTRQLQHHRLQHHQALSPSRTCVPQARSTSMAERWTQVRMAHSISSTYDILLSSSLYLVPNYKFANPCAHAWSTRPQVPSHPDLPDSLSRAIPTLFTCQSSGTQFRTAPSLKSPGSYPLSSISFYLRGHPLWDAMCSRLHVARPELRGTNQRYGAGTNP
jgi:hypothetical protein